MRDTKLERFKRDMQNFEKAASRITVSEAYDGGKEPAAVAWLLKFLSTDLTMLNEWQKDEAFWNVYGFAWDGGQGPFTDVGAMGAMSLTYPETDDDRTKTVMHIQKSARAALADFVTTGVATFPKGEGAMVVLARGTTALRYSGADLAASFYYMAAQLLSRYRHRVKQCEGCSRIMLIGRKDQRFHSQSCQIATYFRKQRAEDKQKKADRLAEEAAKKSNTRQHNKKKISHKGGRRHGTKR